MASRPSMGKNSNAHSLRPTKARRKNIEQSHLNPSRNLDKNVDHIIANETSSDATAANRTAANRSYAMGSDIDSDGRHSALCAPSSPQGTPSCLSSEDIAPPDNDMLPRRSRLSQRRDSSIKVNKTRSRRINVGSIQNVNNLTSTGEMDQTLQTVHNQVKLELLEALRDKKAYSSALLSVKEQKDKLEREVGILRQQNKALEIAMNSNRRYKNGKKAVWSMDSLQNSNIASYQGVCLASGELAKKEAMLLTTETYIDESSNGLRKRNWTGSSIPVSEEIAKKTNLYVLLPNGSYAIPTCAMYRAKTGEHYLSPYTYEKGFAKNCLRKTLSSAVGSMMNESEKAECETLILSHTQTIRKFKSILAYNVGNRKKATLGIFLRSLGYMEAARPGSSKSTPVQKAARIAERDVAYDKCIVVDENGCVDTMQWRLKPWSKICLNSSENDGDEHPMEEIENKMKAEGKVDNIFLNEPARRAFNELRGHEVCPDLDTVHNDVSILSLARADAGMTTMLKWMKVSGRGGVRNSNYNDYFRELLPKAMESIIKEIWDDLEELVPNEMFPYMGLSELSENKQYRNDLREWTCVLMSPEDNYLYLVAKSIYFEKKVCSWLGNVKDGQIGRCHPDETTFTRITSTMKYSEVEESDLDQPESEHPQPENDDPKNLEDG